MKKSLTKIKLINWMHFKNTTIEVKGNVMITGNNSSGKSTIIDALQLILLKDQKKVKFNVAADERTARNVESYVRGKVNHEEKKYLRKDDVTSHIAIEISSGNEASILGMVIDISKGSLATNSYHIENCFITDDLFIETKEGKKKVRPYADFKKYIENKLGKTFSLLYTNADLQNKQREVFGLDAEKYHKLLPKAIGFKSISTVETFVKDFLLDDSKVEIDELKQIIVHIERLNLAIQQDLRKLADLEIISEQYYDLQDHRQKLAYLNLVNKKLTIEKFKNDLSNKIKEINNIDFNLQQIAKRRDEIATSISKLEEEYQEFKNQIIANDATKRIFSLREKSDNLGIELEKVFQKRQELYEKLKIERNIILKLINHGYKFLSTTNDYLAKGDYESSEMNSELSQYKTYLDQIKDELIYKERGFTNNLNVLIEDQKKYFSFVTKLKRGERPYSKDINDLIREIQSAVMLKRNKSIEVTPLCEHIDIKNEEWRKAIEGYLGERKQYLVVDKEYYDDAIEVLERLRAKGNISGVGIIDIKKFSKQPKIVIGSLAEHLSEEFTNKSAHNYAISILNEMKCIDATYELTNYQSAITKETMIYENMSLYRPLRDLFDLPLIGRNSITIQLEIYKKALNKIEEHITDLNNKKSTISDLIRLINNSYVNNLLDSNNTLVASINKFERIVQEKKENDRSLRELQNNSDFVTLESQGQALKVKIGDLKVEDNDLSKKTGILEERKKNTIDFKNKTENNISVLNDEYNLEIEGTENIHYYEYFLKEYNYETHSSTEDSIKENEREIQKVLELIKVKINTLQKSMGNFTYKYNFNAQTTENHFDKYENLLKKIKEENLVKYKKEMEEFKAQNEELFKQKFLNELKMLIENAENNIKTINETLKKRKFGDHEYSIKFGPSKNKEFAEFYEVIKNEARISLTSSFGNDNMGTDHEADRYDAIVRTFIDRLNKAIPGEQYDLRDYRNYINVDIEIKTSTGTTLLSNVKHSQSGGEGQVPFYIIAAASFQNIMMKGKSKDSRLCLVLFDEAFNNMDAQRVEVMMSYFKALDIQIILSLTGEKLHSIAKHVDTTVAIVREGFIADVMPFRGSYE